MNDEISRFWRVHCHTGDHPGQWQLWFRHQCCAVGWPPPRWHGRTEDGWEFDKAQGEQDWVTACRALMRMKPMDWIIATLPGNRVGRLGQVVKLQVQDDEWNPIIHSSQASPFGDIGRRILVRWELSTGPSDPSKVVLLPANAQLNSGERRGTIRELKLEKLEVIRDAMLDEANWVSLSGAFALEKALSDYICVHPYRIEAGMVAHPVIAARELSFSDGSRADVILQDSSGETVVVECKQNAPTTDAITQVTHYRDLLKNEYGQENVRALIVHGGASRVAPHVALQAAEQDVELVYFELQVNFFGSNR